MFFLSFLHKNVNGGLKRIVNFFCTLLLSVAPLLLAVSNARNWWNKEKKTYKWSSQTFVTVQFSLVFSQGLRNICCIFPSFFTGVPFPENYDPPILKPTFLPKIVLCLFPRYLRFKTFCLWSANNDGHLYFSLCFKHKNEPNICSISPFV